MNIKGRTILLISFFWCVAETGLSQTVDCFPIHTRYGEHLPVALTSQTYFPLNKQSNKLLNGSLILFLQFDEIPEQADLPIIQQLGVDLIRYLPQNTYLSKVPETINPQLLKTIGVVGFSFHKSQDKVHIAIEELNNSNKKSTGNIEINAHYIPTLTFTQVRDELITLGYQCNPKEYWNNEVRISISSNDVSALADLQFITWVEPVSDEYEILNFDNPGRHGAEYVRTYMGLSGEGVTIGIGDLGIFDHLDGNTRAINNYALTGTHGNNVAGIIGGAGLIDVRYAGHAPKSKIISEYFNNIITHTPSLFANEGMVLTNNSYGLISCSYNGEYNNNSINKDQQLLEYPEVMHVYACGNSGSFAEDCGFLPNGYGSILGGDQSAKNVLSVGNLDKDDKVFYTSSKGPTVDGRLKPEIVSRAHGAISTGENNLYNAFSGTSAAAPAVTGCLSLMIERYRELNSGNNPKGALVKAIVCNTADDIGNPGPDYANGFGRINVRNAISCIENEHYIEGAVAQGQTNTHNITVPAGKGQLKVMLYWHDLPGAGFTSKALVNDLSLGVLLPTNVIELPLILDPLKPEKYASPGEDTINNIEQIVIDTPEAGNHLVLIKGSQVPFDSQSYYLVYEFINDEVLLTYPMPDMTMVPGEHFPIYWDAYRNTTPFKLSYSVDDGNSWMTIDQNIAPEKRSYQWEVPETVTAIGKLKIERFEEESINNGVFSIFGQTQLKAYKYCNGDAVRLEWDPVLNADLYEIWKLLEDESEMSFLASSNDLEYVDFLVGNQPNTNIWYGIVPKNIAGAKGRRSNAVSPLNFVYDQVLDFQYTTNLLAVNFRGISSVPINQNDTFFWEFGDGSTSTEEQPTHSYALTGLYIVKLTVNSICGSNTITKQIYVSDAATCLVQDSMQLVRFYERTSGAFWTTAWDLTSPISTWFGVTLTPDGCNVLELRLNGNNLSGKLPDFNLPKLEYFSCSNNFLTGDIPDYQLPELTNLILSKNILRGNIPSFTGAPLLNKLSLENNVLIGSIPDFNLPELKYLYLYENGLSGNIPMFSNLTKLTHLYLYNNKLNGAIPNFTLPNLTNLRIQQNVLTSSIPNFTGLPKLKTLYVQKNELSGLLPGLSVCTELIYFYANNNKLTGEIPNYSLPILRRLYLHDNNLSGSIPNFNLPELSNLFLYQNELTGIIPDFMNLPKLKFLYLYNNLLEGSIPKFEPLGLLEIRLFKNQLSGHLPNLSHLNTLTKVQIDRNNLTFSGIEENLNIANIVNYSPQAEIPIYQLGNKFSVKAGGDLTKNTYNWYRNGELVYSNKGDSTYTASGSGEYFCRVYNDVLSDSTIHTRKLILQSRTEVIGTPISIDLSVWLQGAFDVDNLTMTSSLYNKLLLPGQMPIENPSLINRTGQPYYVLPWEYDGSEGGLWNNASYQDFIAENGNKKIVDWVLVAFRQNITHMSMIARAAAVIMEDGSIKFMHPYVIPDWASGPFYIVIEHRNHMGVMTKEPVPVINGTITYDFTVEDTYRGDNQGYGSMQMLPDEYGMVAGDGGQEEALFSYDINGYDRIKWQLFNGSFNAYNNVDYNMDGDVTGLDRIIWHFNNGIYSMVPRPRP